MTPFHFAEGRSLFPGLSNFKARESLSPCVKRDAAFLSIATTPISRARTLLQLDGGWLVIDPSHCWKQISYLMMPGEIC